MHKTKELQKTPWFFIFIFFGAKTILYFHSPNIALS